MYFQALDNKKDCYGFFQDGALHAKAPPNPTQRTWRYTPHIQAENAEFAYLYTGGATLSEACPEELRGEFLKISDKLKAFLRSFHVAKVSLDDNCFYDLVPEKFLLQYFDLKSKITKHVFENYEKPSNYEFLSELDKLLVGISLQKINIDKPEFKKLYGSTGFRTVFNALRDQRDKVEYNLFGTKTGRLSTSSNSFPILTLKKDFRKILKPQNDWFVEVDFNAAELRTLLALSGRSQPNIDIHEWNIENVYRGSVTREEAKKKIFAWLYNPESNDYRSSRIYRRDEVLNKHYDGKIVSTFFGRTIPADDHHALNYIIQSTASDLFLRRAVEVGKILESRKSNVAFLLHDSMVIDLDMEDKPLLKTIISTFSDTELGQWRTNVSVGDTFGTMTRLLWKQ